MKRSYADSRFGQIHARHVAPRDTSAPATLLCLHPAPYSGAYFETVMPMLAEKHTVIAPDYPGYGPHPKFGAQTRSLGNSAPKIADFAAAMLDFLDSSGIDGPVDLLGFHTGCLVAAEMVHIDAARCRRLVLCDIPYFTAAEQDAMRDKVTKPLPLGPDLQSLAGAWSFNVSARLGDVPLPRAFELFVDHLRAGSNDWFAFDAAFRYDCEARFATLEADVVCLATQSGLHAPTLAAAAKIPGAALVDVTEVSSAVFEAGADAIAARILAALEVE